MLGVTALGAGFDVTVLGVTALGAGFDVTVLGVTIVLPLTGFGVAVADAVPFAPD